MSETVRFTYRLRPGAMAERSLVSEWHRCRFLWNEAVHLDRKGLKPTFGKLSRMLTSARSDSRWLSEGSQVAQQQMLRTYARALDDSFTRGKRRPKFKSRKNALPSLEYTRRGFRIRAGRLRLPKGVEIPVVWSRDLRCDPSSVRVFRDSLGHWYASFVVQRNADHSVASTSGGIGIDWGVRTTATTTDPAHDLGYLGHRKRCAAELARAQRRMNRRRRISGAQSKGYLRAKRQAARLAKKSARQVRHDTRVWARGIVTRHSLIAIEDFRPGFLAKTHMARKSSDAAIGTVKRELIERARRSGRTVVLVKPAHTTTTCGRCFARTKQRLDLDTRTFFCTECQHTDNRDRNAARVILAVAERGHTSIDDVRHLQPSSVSVVGAV